MYFCQLTTREGNLREQERVAQRIMRLTMNQEIAASKIDWLGNRLFTPIFSVKQNKSTLSADTRKAVPQMKEEMINQRGHSLYFGDE